MTEKQVRRALFWSYGAELASFRHRLRPVVALLAEAGWGCDVADLSGAAHIRRILVRRRALQRSDVLVISKIKIGPPESWLLRALARRIVFDCDDAVWVRKPRRFGAPPGRSWWARAKFASCCRIADLVTAGNETVAGGAKRFTRRVELVETPVDVDSYPAEPPPQRNGHTLVWIGMPGNLFYLELIRPVLEKLAKEFTSLRLRVVCSQFPAWPEVNVEQVRWSEAGEVAALATAGIGVMPLSDEEWSRGKGAFKLKQYMAANLPCVASPVGVNIRVIRHGETGFLASSPAEWEAALRALLESEEKRTAMGRAGRRLVLQHYDRRVVARRVVDLLESLTLS